MRNILCANDDNATLDIESIFIIKEKRVKISFFIKGLLAEYVFPLKSEKKRANELWKATCFELFLANSTKEAYYELNFSSSLAWNFYYLSGYRAEVKELQNISNPKIEVYKSDNKFKIVLEMEVENLKEFDSYNVACIVLNKKNERIFWSVHHHLNRPDFHNKNNFLKIT